MWTRLRSVLAFCIEMTKPQSPSMKTQQSFLIAGLSCLLLVGAAQNAFASDTANQLNALLDKIVGDHRVWASNASLLRALTLFVAIIGLVVGIIRPLQFRGSKTLGIVL